MPSIFQISLFGCSDIIRQWYPSLIHILPHLPKLCSLLTVLFCSACTIAFILWLEKFLDWLMRWWMLSSSFTGSDLETGVTACHKQVPLSYGALEMWDRQGNPDVSDILYQTSLHQEDEGMFDFSRDRSWDTVWPAANCGFCSFENNLPHASGMEPVTKIMDDLCKIHQTLPCFRVAWEDLLPEDFCMGPTF